MKQLAALLILFGLWSTSALADPPSWFVHRVSCAGNDGAIKVWPHLADSPYTFLWNTGATTDSIGGLAPGTYSVTVTTSAGESHEYSYTLAPYDAAAILAEDVWYAGNFWYEPCQGECNGGIELMLPSFSEEYVFTTDPPVPFQVQANSNWLSNTEGSYTRYVLWGFCDGTEVQITASTSCYTSGPMPVVSIQSLPPAELEILAVAPTCGSANDGYVAGVVTIPAANHAAWDVGVLVDYNNPGGLGGGVTIPDTTVFPFQFDGLQEGDWFVYLEQLTYTGCVYQYPVRISDRSPNCATLSGTVHFETDEDCVQDGLELGMPNQLIRVTPGPYYGVSGPDGSYHVAVPDGNFMVDQMNPDAVQVCPVGVPVPFSVGVNGSATVDFADSLLTPFNARLHLWNAYSRVGFPFEYRMTIANDNGYVGENIVVSLDFDPIFSFISGTPGITSNTPGQIEWSFPNLAPFEQRSVVALLQVPPDPALLGNYYTATATISSSTSEGVLTDNMGSITHRVISSYDPNDKQAFTSSRTSDEMYLKDVDAYIDYLIRFQNTGNDTAFTVVVTDTISPLLDLGSLQILGASHPYIPSIESGNVLRFQFDDILLPDSNVNEVASHGMVAFRLKPMEEVSIGSYIDNAADIYFDFNEPVRTNTARLEVSVSTNLSELARPELRLAPVPTSDQLTLQFDGVLTAIGIYSTDGRLVEQLPGSRTIDVSHLPVGLYLLQARTADGAVLQGRFVKR